MVNTKAVLVSRPQGMVDESDFRIETESVRDIQEGEILIKVKALSLDPALRGWMNKGTTYIKGVDIGTVMRCFAAGEIIQSQHPNFEIGEHVSGLLGAQSMCISDGKGLTKCDLDKGPLSYHLGVLGMPGMTAYFGLLEKGKPQTGETVFISGAAGIVGSTVGQIAKIKGCTVIGIAGGPEKCKYVVDTLGFDGCIDYKNESVYKGIKAHCPKGIDVYFDNVGGDILDAALSRLRRHARVVICGAISQYNNTAAIKGPSNYLSLLVNRATMQGMVVMDYAKDYRKAGMEMGQWMMQGKLKTEESIFEGIENFKPTYERLFTGDKRGKLLLKISE